MDTVELKGLQYKADLKDKMSAFFLILTATLETKVGAGQRKKAENVKVLI